MPKRIIHRVMNFFALFSINCLPLQVLSDDICIYYLVYSENALKNEGVQVQAIFEPDIVMSKIQEAGDLTSEYLFDPSILSSDIVGEVPNGLHVRPLRLSDYSSGFLDILSQLTVVGEISFEEFEQRFRSMKAGSSPPYYVVVIEDLSSGRVIGAATLVIEWKFIHHAGCRGRVEDVVVDKEMRGKKLGALLNRVLVALAKKVGVYKLSLECKDSLISFYELYGYTKDVNFLVQRFDRDPEVVIPSADDDLEVRIPSNI
ncbi:hypothetical protein Q1695_012204 [Nippostrongylus brasiliensis]|nr:hypothetical protein Q1695_012204 [Nippostrongylus brasiliensis]